MKTTHLSNPAASLLLAEIGTMLQDVDTDTFVGYSIFVSMNKDCKPVREIAEELASQIQDNREAVARCIGIRLVEKIEKYKSVNI